MASGLELAVKEPLLTLGVLEAGAPVVVDFKDVTLRGLDTIVITVAPQPPLPAAQGALPEAIIGPGFDYFGDNIFLVIKAKRSGHLNLAARGDLDLSTEELWSHNRRVFD